MTPKNLEAPMVLSGTSAQLKQITSFCRAVYHRTFGEDEGQRRLTGLSFMDAVALWNSGLPDSATTP